MENFLVREKFWLKSWKLLDADESYVRSATVRFIGLVHENLRLREILLTDQSLVSDIISENFRFYFECCFFAIMF